MTDRAAQLVDQALKLTQAERAEIAARLLETLDPDSASEDSVDAAWAPEIRRRAERVLDGEPGVPWPEAKARILEKLRQR